MADGLRRLDGVADVEVDLQQNVCAVTPDPDRVPALAGMPAAVRSAGYRPERLWLRARGAYSRRDGDASFTVAGTGLQLRVSGPARAAGGGEGDGSDANVLEGLVDLTTQPPTVTPAPAPPPR